jgi:DNA (cytosine-5)-methyltransferase 1
MLSVVELYQPDYVVLENVVGLLHLTVRGVKQSILKLITRGLDALGYQVHSRVVQAAQYGAPQERQRLIIVGAKRGLEQIRPPTPTHASKPTVKHGLHNNADFIPPITRGRGPGDEHLFAPHASVTISDAIGDLVSKIRRAPHSMLIIGNRT